MKGFVIASIDPTKLKQSIGLEERMIRYTSVIGKNTQEVATQFLAQMPHEKILLSMPIATLKKRIAEIENAAEKHQIILES
jgi:hypothetical protein